jgi:hypothetical protein
MVAMFIVRYHYFRVFPIGINQAQGEIGVLDRKDMDSFASIFINYQKIGACNDPEGRYASFVDDSFFKAFSFFAEKASLLAKLGPWRQPDARGKKRADVDNDKFTIKYAHTPKILERLNVVHPRFLLYRCLGVWDTVGELGLPEELTPIPKKAVQLFGFQDRLLGDHIEAAYQALALNEMRVDFVSGKVQFCEIHS